jgi:hypothetical protein
MKVQQNNDTILDIVVSVDNSGNTDPISLTDLLLSIPVLEGVHIVLVTSDPGVGDHGISGVDVKYFPGLSTGELKDKALEISGARYITFLEPTDTVVALGEDLIDLLKEDTDDLVLQERLAITDKDKPEYHLPYTILAGRVMSDPISMPAMISMFHLFPGPTTSGLIYSVPWMQYRSILRFGPPTSSSLHVLAETVRIALDDFMVSSAGTGTVEPDNLGHMDLGDMFQVTTAGGYTEDDIDVLQGWWNGLTEYQKSDYLRRLIWERSRETILKSIHLSKDDDRKPYLSALGITEILG